MKEQAPAANEALRRWEQLRGLPGGSWLFSKILGWTVPYTGSVSPRILELEPGRARVAIRERHAIRNHLRSVHAVALVNVAELAGNLAALASMPADARFIVLGLSIEYLKKARGTIVAHADTEPVTTSAKREYEIPVELTDDVGDVVARATIRTLVGPREKTP